MKVKNIKIKNIASFKDFSSDMDFEKKTLLFGTNGSGKSTIASLLQLIDRYNASGNSLESVNEVKAYISNKISKEANSEISSIEIFFQNDSEKITYNKTTDLLTFGNNTWSPVKVFNEKYTERTIGNVVDINLRDSGLLIGEPNILLDTAQKKHDGLVKKIDNIESKFIKIVDDSVNNYSIVANSSANVSDTISVYRLKQSTCEFNKNNDIIEQRKLLGYDKPVDNLNIITYKILKNIVDPESFIDVFNESIDKPELDKEKESLLLNYTQFYKSGVEAYHVNENSICPFCFQVWEDSENAIREYTSFLNSTYNNKRSLISSVLTRIKSLDNEIRNVNGMVNSIKSVVEEEGRKYNIETNGFKDVVLQEQITQDIEMKVKKKLSNMELPIEIGSDIQKIITIYQNSIIALNGIIQKIKDSITKIRSKRMMINKEIAKHMMRNIWDDNARLREDYINTAQEIKEIQKNIIELEKQEINQDTICTVFNGIIDFLGLSEYHISNEKKLILKLNRDYDISHEGGRISSSQKKILSLSYFIAEIISELKTPTDLKKYILIFDDPVDSADYIYFHSITALLENIEVILNKILKKSNLRIGQIIVMTHNSLLYERLYKNYEFKRTIRKIDNLTEIVLSDRTMNNYKIYLEYIIRYYKNPRKNRKDMIFIGNLIRRVLEILSNFNDLSSNEFTKYIFDIGKPKLSLLANHLSHESFTKVLNPFISENELKEACKELLEVIEISHPVQYKYIEKEMIGIDEI